MKKSKDTTNTETETPTAPMGTPETPATKPAGKAKAVKAPKVEKAAKTAKPAKADTDGETTDRLPTSVKELKETKGGFVAYLFLSGKDRDAIAKELGDAFKLPDAQALKITRRITGRVRLYRRMFELMPAKEA